MAVTTGSGSFVLAGTAETVLPEKLDKVPVRRSIMSHTLRRMQRPGDTHLRIIASNELPSFWSDTLPNPQQQADNLIGWIGDNQASPSTWFEVPVTELGAAVGLSLVGARDSQAWGWLHKELEEQKLYQLKDAGGGKNGFLLTMRGWNAYESLKRTHAESRTAFMAMQFGDEVLNRVVTDCFKPAVAKTGFELRMLSDNPAAGVMDVRLRAAILSARFLIADLTHDNAGAYFEAGFADGLGLPVIYTCEAGKWKKSKTHFDTNHNLTIIWDASNLEVAGEQLTNTIRATLRAEAKQTDDGT
jgi:hypothetical protein